MVVVVAPSVAAVVSSGAAKEASAPLVSLVFTIGLTGLLELASVAVAHTAHEVGTVALAD